jgi:hypothetical protein
MSRIELDGCELQLLSVIKGLVSEAEKVRDAMTRFQPDAVGISISKEELIGLREGEYEEYEPSDLEMAYGELLSTFGEVELPPPCYVVAMELCDAQAIPLIPVDMNEEMFSKAYCDLVSGGDLLREGLFAKRAMKRRFDLSSPEAFVRDWDVRSNRPPGFRKLERQREEHMASALRKLCAKHRRVLAVIEEERSDGVLSFLEN